MTTRWTSKAFIHSRTHSAANAAGGIGMTHQTRLRAGSVGSVRRLLRLGIALLLAGVVTQTFAAWEGYERFTRETLLAKLAQGTGKPLDLKAVNLSDLDLHEVNFRGANLSASVFNGANLRSANLDNANLTVAFLERADLSNASLRNAVLFSAQMAGAILRGADLDGVRFIGDLKKTDFTDAKMTHMKGAADMKNQSMGLMHTSMVGGTAINADMSDSDFSRAELTFSDFSHAKMVKSRFYRADFSGSKLVGVDLTGADLHDALLIDVDLTNANLTNADLTGANLQGVRGLDTTIKTAARGLP
jgi:uncharacterized protein YjbI with pentapeptide repeats